MIIGITGGSGCGKSIICEMLQEKYDVKIIDADKISRKLSKKGSKYLNEIVEVFGQDILDEQGELNRRKLSQIIYTDSKKRQKLNNCTFKYIKSEIKSQIEITKEISTIIIDAPLLFESKLDELCDKVIGVISKRELQIQRIMTRDNITYDDAKKRLNAQQKNSFYIDNCDEIIKNNEDIFELEEDIERVAKEYNITKKLH